VIYLWVFLDFSVWVDVNLSFEWILEVGFWPDKLGKQNSGPARNKRGLNYRVEFEDFFSVYYMTYCSRSRYECLGFWLMKSEVSGLSKTMKSWKREKYEELKGDWLSNWDNEFIFDVQGKE